MAWLNGKTGTSPDAPKHPVPDKRVKEKPFKRVACQL